MVHYGDDDQGVNTNSVHEIEPKSKNARPTDITEKRLTRMRKLKKASRQRPDFCQKVFTQTRPLLLVAADGVEELGFGFI